MSQVPCCAIHSDKIAATPTLKSRGGHAKLQHSAVESNKLNPSPESTLFVGNLSFFCEERHLFELFDQYAHVHHVRIMRNDFRTRSLMFGFVTLGSLHEANELERLLNGTFFMGRKLRVALRRGTAPSTEETLQVESPHFPVHVTFSSNFTASDKLFIQPTQAWLRKQFMKYGVLLDCSVKDYQHSKASNKQDGYGFVVFESYEIAATVTQTVQNVNWQEITISCNMPRVPFKSEVALMITKNTIQSEDCSDAHTDSLAWKK